MGFSRFEKVRSEFWEANIEINKILNNLLKSLWLIGGIDTD